MGNQEVKLLNRAALLTFNLLSSLPCGVGSGLGVNFTKRPAVGSTDLSCASAISNFRTEQIISGANLNVEYFLENNIACH